jgi:hypothetical protein
MVVSASVWTKFQCDPITLCTLMPALVAGIHAFSAEIQQQGVNVRHKPAISPEKRFNMAGIRSNKRHSVTTRS